MPIGLIDSATVEIDNNGSGALDLSQVNPTLDPEFSLTTARSSRSRPASSAQFTVTFQPYKVGSVHVDVHHPDRRHEQPVPGPDRGSTGNIVTVVLTGNGIQLSLVVQPNVLDFGNTLINTTTKKSVTLINKSTAPVTGITATVIGGDANLFTVDNAPTTLGRRRFGDGRHQLLAARARDPVARHASPSRGRTRRRRPSTSSASRWEWP